MIMNVAHVVMVKCDKGLDTKTPHVIHQFPITIHSLTSTLRPLNLAPRCSTFQRQIKSVHQLLFPLDFQHLLAPKPLTQSPPHTNSLGLNQKSTNMPTLDTIPADMLREISDHLAFFDKVSLSLTSKTCRAKLGAFNCPDYLSWAAYLCLNAHIYPSYQQIYLLPKFDLALHNVYTYIMQQSSPPLGEGVLRKIHMLEFQLGLYYNSFTEQEWFEDPNVGGLRLAKPTKPSSSNQASASYRPDLLLRPYFPGLKYPENTLAQLYLGRIMQILGRKGTQEGAGEEVGRLNLTM